jgi:hypothetical protein
VADPLTPLPLVLIMIICSPAIDARTGLEQSLCAALPPMSTADTAKGGKWTRGPRIVTAAQCHKHSRYISALHAAAGSWTERATCCDPRAYIKGLCPEKETDDG